MEIYNGVTLYVTLGLLINNVMI